MPANPKLSSEVHPGTKNYVFVVCNLHWHHFWTYNMFEFSGVKIAFVGQFFVYFVNSCLKAPSRFLMSFLDLKYFSCFWMKSLFFYTFFFKKQEVSVGLRRLFHQKLSEHLSRGEIALKFAIFRFFLKNLNCSYLLIKSP